MIRLITKSGGCHDRTFFEDVGLYKKAKLIGLCHLLDQKGMDYDTRILRKLSRGEISHLVAELRGKKFNPTKGQQESFEKRGVIISDNR